MTTRLLPRTLRIALPLGLPLGLVAAAGPAAADVPQGWSDPEPVSTLHFLGVVAVAPIGLALVITLLVYLPSLVRGQAGAGGTGGGDQWFGGPTRGTAELAAPDREDSKAGGAGVRW